MGQRRAVQKVCAAILFAVSCGSSKPPDQTAAVLAACTQLHQTMAALESGCWGGAASDWQAYSDELAPCAKYAQHVADGSVKFAADALPSCVSAIQTSSCNWPSQCENTDVFIGQAPDGTPCSIADFSICGPQSLCPTYDCNPTCQRMTATALGQPCAGTGCQYGLWCDAGQNDICIAPAAEGGYCGGVSDDPCAQGLYCMLVDPNNTPTGGTCVPQSTGPCSYDYECPSSQFCHQGTCTKLRRLGASCADTLTGCEAFSVCDTTSATPTCIHAGLPGEACAPPGFACLGGTICGPNFTCIAKPQLGEACSGPTCAEGLYCNGSCMQCPTPDGGQP